MSYEAAIEDMKKSFKQDLTEAKEKYKDYWLKWETIVGRKHEGVLLEIDNGTYIVLCTDGRTRAV